MDGNGGETNYGIENDDQETYETGSKNKAEGKKDGIRDFVKSVQSVDEDSLEEMNYGSVSLSTLSVNEGSHREIAASKRAADATNNASSASTSASPVSEVGADAGTIWSESAIDELLGPPDRRLLKGATTNLQTMMHVFKGNVGPGILAMPYAFANVGMIPGFLGTILIALINVHCMRLVVFASHKLCHKTGSQALDFGYCMDYAFEHCQGASPRFKKAGRYMRKAVNLFLQITQLGFCCIYFVFISENMGQVLNHHVFGIISDVATAGGSHNAGTGGGGLSTRVYMAALLPFLMALSCVRDIRTLAYCSVLANALCIGGFILIFFQLVQDLPPFDSIPLINDDYTVWPIYIATTVYAFEGIGVVLPLENKMRTPSALLPWNGVLNTAMTVVSCLFLAMGFYGYLKYGSECRGSITLNLPPHAPINEVVKVMFAIAIYFTYSVQFYVPVQIIWPILKKRVQNENLVNVYERVFRCCLVLFTFSIAVAIPHLGPFISLIGAFASTALAMLFPVIIDTLVNWESSSSTATSSPSSPSSSSSSLASRLRLCKNGFIFVFGSVSFVFGTTQSIREIIKAFAHD